MVWFLLLHLHNAGTVVIPTPYATKAECVAAAAEPQTGGTIYRFACVPAPKPSAQGE